MMYVHHMIRFYVKQVAQSVIFFLCLLYVEECPYNVNDSTARVSASRSLFIDPVYI